ncbi:Cyclase family protein [Desulfamplus magnetovallimortis]|uniref:Kynurenine formamidase n=1 Tax=Desulfamplus magnetovallimortis TaxID=1246637 RepID=A0A1W1HJP0_9BACT|nr:cyclase family protein [Desulfamplus magnetovallimortis]SLM32625.1 Cyclase family protein [Desulfamplus magnetovallimortis]
MKINFSMVYDISVSLGETSIDYPGDTPFSKHQTASIEPHGFDLSKLVLSAHSGTHIDAPSHFRGDGDTIDTFSPDQFILPARVVDATSCDLITPCVLKNVSFSPEEAILFKTRNSLTGISTAGKFTESYAAMTLEAARICAENRTPLVGIDYITIEPYGNTGFPVHHLLLRNNILILEGITLAHVPQGSYTLICLPLKIKDAEASPVRAILLA